jgi:hypothetical protein
VKISLLAKKEDVAQQRFPLNPPCSSRLLYHSKLRAPHRGTFLGPLCVGLISKEKVFVHTIHHELPQLF